MKTFRDYQKRAKQLVCTPGRGYLLITAGVLGLSTVIWSFAIARLQQGNANQLADGFLFENGTTFTQAQFPSAHTQLLKWPLFWLLGAMHSAPSAYIISTVVLCLVAIGGFAYLLFRIVRRPEVLGTLYLGLACILALVPAQILKDMSSPLSMAMVTGRNVEYLLNIGILVFILPSQKRRDWPRWGAATLLMGLLLSSDQLFLACNIGGSVGLLLYAYGWHRRLLVVTAWLWLAVAGLGWALSRLVLDILGRITGIVGASTSLYGGTTNLPGMHAATVDGLRGILMNFGVTVSAGRWDVLPALLNTLLLGSVVYASYRVGRHVLQPLAQPDKATMLSLLLGMSTLAALAAYVVTNHPVAADARYLSVALFAGFVILATYSRTLRVSPKLLYGCGGVLVVGIMFGLVGVVSHTDQTIASDPLRVRNERIVQALAAHHEQILVGDFWRVLPIKEETKQASQQILPLTNCLQPRQSLTSSAWNQSLYTHSFAYLLPLQSFGAPFGRCSVQTLVLIYGRPTAVTLIAGSPRNPTELLLFYNNGAARIRGNETVPPTPVFGVPTEGRPRPTGSMIVPLTDPS
jgi:hypothetical protein